MINIILKPSKRKNKKFSVQHPSIGTIHFGDSRYEDYTQHKDKERKKLYLERHRKREDWTRKGIGSAGFWTRWILWEKDTIEKAVQHLNGKYKSMVIEYVP